MACFIGQGLDSDNHETGTAERLMTLARQTSATPGPATAQADGATVLLGALAWICSDDTRARRLIELTGLDAETLRQRAGDPDLLHAVGRFLCDHEPDLVACAAQLGVAPGRLVDATSAMLGGGDC